MSDCYGYGCLNKATKNIIRSTTYQALRGRFIPPENIYIDILEKNPERHYLNYLINTCKINDTIVILNPHTLGNTKSFKHYWNLLNDKKINLLIIDNKESNGVGKFSTTDFTLIRFNNKTIDSIAKELDSTVFERQTSLKGRKELTITDNFIKVYWLYQSFKISAEEGYTALGISKQSFYTLCKRYEQNSNYMRLLNYYDYLTYFPHRGGGITPQLRLLFQKVEYGKIDLKEACEQLDINPPLDQSLYKRYLLAEIGGKKQQYELEKKYHDTSKLKDLNKCDSIIHDANNDTNIIIEFKKS